MEWLTERKEYWQPSPGGCRALLVSFGFLILGFLTLIIMKSMLNIEQDAVLVAILLLAPVLIFLILSGKLLEISAGGVSAKFNDAAQKLLNEDEMNTLPMTENQVAVIMRNEGLAGLQQMLQRESYSQYIVLTVTLGKTSDPEPSLSLLNYLRALSQYRNFTFLALLEDDGRVYGYIRSWQAIQILELEEIMYPGNLNSNNSFDMAIITGQKKELLRYGLIKATVKPTDTNISVLKKMTELNINILIVTDENGKIKNVVEREQVLSKLMLALTK